MADGLSLLPAYEHLFRILCFGEELLENFGLEQNEQTTMDVALYKAASLKFDATIARLQLLGLGGQRKFRMVTPDLFRALHAVIVCYDITDSQSVPYLKSTLKEIRVVYPFIPKNVLAVVGLQSNRNRVVDLYDVKDLVTAERALYFEVSLGDRLGIEQTFIDLSRSILQSKTTGKYDFNQGAEAIFRIISSSIVIEADSLLVDSNSKSREKASPKKVLDWFKSPKQSRKERSTSFNLLPTTLPPITSPPITSPVTSPFNSPRSPASPTVVRKPTLFRHVTPEVDEFLQNPPPGVCSLSSSSESWDAESNTGPLVHTLSSPSIMAESRSHRATLSTKPIHSEEFTIGHIRDGARAGRRTLFGAQRSPMGSLSTTPEAEVAEEKLATLYSRLEQEKESERQRAIAEEERRKEKGKEDEEGRENQQKKIETEREKGKGKEKENNENNENNEKEISEQVQQVERNETEREAKPMEEAKKEERIISTPKLDPLGNSLIDAFIAGDLDFSQLAAMTTPTGTS